MSGDGRDCDSLGAPYILSKAHCKIAARAMSIKWLGGNCQSEKDVPKGCRVVSKWNDWYPWACFNELANGVRRKGYQNICQNNYGVF